MSKAAEAGQPPTYTPSQYPSSQGLPQGPGPQYPPAGQQPYPEQQPYPPSQGYPGYGQPGQPTGAQTVVVAPVVTAPPVMRESPVAMVCPHCQASITTSQTYTAGTLTWLAAGGICLFGLWLGCCLIPFCLDSLKDVVHLCPSCSREVGRFRRM